MTNAYVNDAVSIEDPDESRFRMTNNAALELCPFALDYNLRFRFLDEHRGELFGRLFDNGFRPAKNRSGLGLKNKVMYFWHLIHFKPSWQYTQ